MKLNLIMIAGGLVVAGIAGAAGTKMHDEERAKAVQTFRIAEADLPMMQACESTLTSEKIEFKSKVSTISACGCVAREVDDRISSDERAFAAAAFPKMAVAAVREDKDNKRAQEFVMLVLDHKISPQRAETVMSAMTDALATCSAHEVYRSAEENQQIADDKAKKKENSRIAFDELVKDGHMTREEADRRLSRM